MRKFLFVWGLLILATLPQVNARAEEVMVPKWLERVELSAQMETDAKPTYYFQTVQPLYQSADLAHTIFIEPRVSSQEGDQTYNLGAGYRYLVNENLLLGANVFGDYQATHEHHRVGVGLEALTQTLEARANGYFATSKRREIQSTGSTTIYEKAVDGFDAELGAPVPYLPWLKIFASGYWYNYEKFKNKYGWKNRVEASISKAIKLEFYTFDDNKGDREYGTRIRTNIAFDSL